MTATSQWVKIVKPILGSPAVFFFFTEQRKSGILQTSQNSLYFPCCLCSLCCYSLKAQYDPQTQQALCCYFQYKISIQELLDASQCLFSTPTPTRFSLNARQIEHFWNWHFSRSICLYHAHLNVTKAYMHDHLGKKSTIYGCAWWTWGNEEVPEWWSWLPSQSMRCSYMLLCCVMHHWSPPADSATKLWSYPLSSHISHKLSWWR